MLLSKHCKCGNDCIDTDFAMLEAFKIFPKKIKQQGVVCNAYSSQKPDCTNLK